MDSWKQGIKVGSSAGSIEHHLYGLNDVYEHNLLPDGRITTQKIIQNKKAIYFKKATSRVNDHLIVERNCGAIMDLLWIYAEQLLKNNTYVILSAAVYILAKSYSLAYKQLYIWTWMTRRIGRIYYLFKMRALRKAATSALCISNLEAASQRILWHMYLKYSVFTAKNGGNEKYINKIHNVAIKSTYIL